MKYSHAIIYKGKFYRAGEEVPVEEAKKLEGNSDNTPDKEEDTEAAPVRRGKRAKE